MVLEDWKLMRTRRLKQLDEAIHSYRQYNSEQGEEELTPEEAKARWKQEAELIARIHDAVHQLRDALNSDIHISSEMAGIPTKEFPAMSLEKPKDALIDLDKIHQSLPDISHRKAPQRQLAAVNLIDELISYVGKTLRKIDKVVPGESGRYQREHEARGIFKFLILVNDYHDKSIIDTQHTGDFAEEIWKGLSVELRQKLKSLVPPLTWGEIFYHFLRDLEDRRGEPNADRQRKCVGEYLSPLTEFYCLDCDQTFAVDSRHPGCFVCKRCRARERKRKQRQNERESRSGQPTSSRA